ncbi:hypothetical protein [Rhodococcus sp. SMB37]|uniref:hypothetical protein n=1 Tax=Rhodococcus sp. SMB37 TaxID=2512213 RepID=UPI0010503CC2|nr:hypothetical protein [Rhodococcus sp. SMB37]
METAQKTTTRREWAVRGGIAVGAAAIAVGCVAGYGLIPKDAPVDDRLTARIQELEAGTPLMDPNDPFCEPQPLSPSRPHVRSSLDLEPGETWPEDCMTPDEVDQYNRDQMKERELFIAIWQAELAWGDAMDESRAWRESRRDPTVISLEGGPTPNHR